MASFRQSRYMRALVATVKDYGRLRIGDHAAALTYYAVLAVFPGLIVMVALLNLFGDEGTVESVLRIIEELAPDRPPTRSRARRGTRSRAAAPGSRSCSARSSRSSAPPATSARSTGPPTRSTRSKETRPFWHTLPRQVVLTFFVVVVLALALLAVVVTGPLAEAIGDEIGIGNAALDVWSVVKWPVLAAVITLMFAVLLHKGPNVEHESFRLLLPGCLLAMVLWLLASAGFAAYVSPISAPTRTRTAASRGSSCS